MLIMLINIQIWHDNRKLCVNNLKMSLEWNFVGANRNSDPATPPPPFKKNRLTPLTMSAYIIMLIHAYHERTLAQYTRILIYRHRHRYLDIVYTHRCIDTCIHA